MVSKRSSAAKSLGLPILFDFRQLLVIQVNGGFSFRSELLRSLCILKPLGWLLSAQDLFSLLVARAVPQKAFVLLVRYLSADQSFDPAAFRRVTYAQRKKLLFSVATSANSSAISDSTCFVNKGTRQRMKTGLRMAFI